MFCPECGKELPETANFCDACGARAAAPEVAVPVTFTPEPEAGEEPKGKKVTENIVLGTDGKYHWYYEFKLMKNPTILFVLWKIFFWIFVGMFVVFGLIFTIGGTFDFKELLNFGKSMLFIMLGVEVLTAISYFIYAMMQGFKYCVMFEMDENGVTHTQMPKQFKKAQAAAAILVFLGAAAGKPGAVGTGILAGTKNCMASTWTSVRSVEIFRKRDVIKVNERLNKNQVYAKPEDFQFVEDFIKSHVTKKCKISE